MLHQMTFRQKLPEQDRLVSRMARDRKSLLLPCRDHQRILGNRKFTRSRADIGTRNKSAHRVSTPFAAQHKKQQRRHKKSLIHRFEIFALFLISSASTAIPFCVEPYLRAYACTCTFSFSSVV